jgi:hypothetical protein
MGNARLPGPLCLFLGSFDIDTGTLCRQRLPTQGPAKRIRAPGKGLRTGPSKEELLAIQDSEASTIEKLVEAFATDMTAEAATLRSAKLKQPGNAASPLAADTQTKPPTVPVVTFSLSCSKESKIRTPEEQTVQVANSKSWVCWGAHMSHRARQVLMKVDGKVAWDAKKAFGSDFEAFKTKWGEVMKKHCLKNYKADDGWAAGDEFHLEPPNSRMPHSDKRAQACLAEYARLTREGGKSKNLKFEHKYKDLIKPHAAKYEKTGEDHKLP